MKNQEKDVCITRHGYRFRISDLSENKLDSLKKDLTVKPFNLDYDMKKEDIEKAKYKLYKLSDKHITVPRYYGIEHFGNAKINMNVDDININFTGKLRDYQTEIVDKCLTQIKHDGGGILSIFCGGGKTVMAINIAQRLGLKTLVLVHKSFLQDQWVERVKQFTNARIGIIRQKKADVKNKDIVIGMVQSISKRNYDPSIFHGFGLTIYDEAHHMSSRVFSRALIKTGAKYTLALSATPYRGDGLIKVLHWYVGNTIYQQKYKINNQVSVKVFTYYTKHKLFVEKKRWIMSQKKSKPDPIKMIGNLWQIEERTQHIANIINTIKKDPNRKIIVLSHRIKHLEKLKQLVDEDIEKCINDKTLLKDEIKTYYFIGKLKPNERKEAEERGDILFATYDMAKEALDVERLNTIILATPLKDVKQSVGRIMRKVLANGDMRPLIIDIVDNLSVFTKHAELREKFYKKVRYNIEYSYLYQNELISCEEYQSLFESKPEKKSYPKLNLEDALYVDEVEILNEIDTGNNDDNVFDSDSSSEEDVFSKRIDL